MKINGNRVSTLEKKQKKNKQQKKERKYNHYSSEKKTNKYRIESHQEKNNLLNINGLEKSLTSSDIIQIDDNYQKDLYKKFMQFLQKNKFKISNSFDAKHSKKFLDKKNKCLEKIILSDIIENTNNNFESKKTLVENSNLNFDSKRSSIKVNKKFRTQKDVNKYFIVVTNYDEGIKSKNTENIN